MVFLQALGECSSEEFVWAMRQGCWDCTSGFPKREVQVCVCTCSTPGAKELVFSSNEAFFFFFAFGIQLKVRKKYAVH